MAKVGDRGAEDSGALPAVNHDLLTLTLTTVWVDHVQTRGLGVRVDTAQSAEHDIANLCLPTARLNAIERSLRHKPVKEQDDAAGEIRIRTLDELDIGFLVTRDTSGILVTIVFLRPSRRDGGLAKKLRALGVVATIRGALGI